MKRSALKRTASLSRGSGLGRRGTAIKAKRKPAITETEAKLALTFHDETLRYMPCCAVCGYVGPHLEAHHVLPQSVIRAELRSAGQEATTAALWDVRNGMTLCAEPAPNRCHNRHTNGVQRVPLSKLRECHYEVARELDAMVGTEVFTVRLDRDYARGAA